MDSGDTKLLVEPHERLEEGGHSQAVRWVLYKSTEEEKNPVVATVMTLSL